MNRLLAFKNIWLILGNSRHWLALAPWLICASAASAQQFPYLAYVTGQQSYVRSGPGQRYYPTGQIPVGFAVEVYRHDGKGWCAIRPPEGSFSWVPSHQVRRVDAAVVEVVGDRVVARVGSALSPDRSAVQVLLPKGERVEIFAAEVNDDPRWVRVAAPAGEFRWIAASVLSLQPPIEAAPLPQSLPESSPRSSTSGWSRQSQHSKTDPHGKRNVFDHLYHRAAVVQSSLQSGAPTNFPAGKPAPFVQTNRDAMDVVAGSPAELELAQFQSHSAGLAPPVLLGGSNATAMPTKSTADASQPRVRFRGLTPPPSGTMGSVDELELRLSQAVVQPPKQWELGPLETAANSLLAETKTPPVRAQLREVLQRIARFELVQQRYNNPPPATAASSIVREEDPFATTQADDSTQSELTGISSSIRKRAQHDLTRESGPSTVGPASSINKPLYDAAGLLKPVVSKREQAPQYALVDEQGKVVSFVTPTPDLNLKPYIGRRIGVHGTRGFMPEYRRAHVTAGRVTPIEDTIRR